MPLGSPRALCLAPIRAGTRSHPADGLLDWPLLQVRPVVVQGGGLWSSFTCVRSTLFREGRCLDRSPALLPQAHAGVLRVPCRAPLPAHREPVRVRSVYMIFCSISCSRMSTQTSDNCLNILVAAQGRALAGGMEGTKGR